ncbi:hypothetical protein J6590_033809 [Homalodisca vitripennis]|nr:hypothetical protein J6590_033809 [Homalodisca vitripennis]
MYLVSGQGGSKLYASPPPTPCPSRPTPGMPLAATLKSQMLRLLRRSKSTRSNQAMVIPNKRYSAVIPESPSVVVDRARDSSRHRSYSHSQARRQSKLPVCFIVEQDPLQNLRLHGNTHG